MGTENAQMKVIKWERIWDDNREKKNMKREREYLLQLQFELLTSKESKIVATAKPKNV